MQAALNGDRIHPAAPRTPGAIAEAARASVDTGAQSVQVRAFDDAGRETLDGMTCAKVLRAIAASCPGTPISLTTSVAIVEDANERFRIARDTGTRQCGFGRGGCAFDPHAHGCCPRS
ncbi:MAG TPA: 3-keto-5-aminohexanoate cleavage protein [Candidatus Acidoferrum sp.]|nr:3-keto-5-aminohexanoate cleavage protein [Candidatus Acidoferrum sp.]